MTLRIDVRIRPDKYEVRLMEVSILHTGPRKRHHSTLVLNPHRGKTDHLLNPRRPPVTTRKLVTKNKTFPHHPRVRKEDYKEETVQVRMW